MTSIVLASSSPYRSEILRKLGLPFETAEPATDETPAANESATTLVERLAIAKARAVAEQHSSSLIIGSDQVAVLDERILGKPLTHENAVRQLQDCSGRTVTFYTGLCLLDTSDNSLQSCVEPFRVHFRQLNSPQIDRYLHQEQPYNCAGSFMCEGLGICLFERLEGDDPNTLIGLPLIRLVSMLMARGVRVPA